MSTIEERIKIVRKKISEANKKRAEDDVTETQKMLLEMIESVLIYVETGEGTFNE